MKPNPPIPSRRTEAIEEEKQKWIRKNQSKQASALKPEETKVNTIKQKDPPQKT